MITKILLALMLVPCFSFAQGQRNGPPKMSQEAQSALEACGISKPEKGQRPSRENREAVKACLSEAGIEMRRPRHKRRGRNSEFSEESSTVN